MNVPDGARGLVAALQFLTRIPTPQLVNYSPDDNVAASKWFPLVGLLIGGLIATAFWIGARTSASVGGLTAVLAWVWVTGALHLDGLADSADGLGAAHGDRDKFLAVARDPTIGTFGAVALVLVLISKIVLLGALTQSTWLGLVLIPAWARLGPLVWRNLVPPLGDGRGQAFAAEIEWTGVLVNGSVLAIASLAFAPVLLLLIVALPLVAGYWRYRLDGMSGDCHGASIESIEVVGLLLLVVSAGA